MIAIKHIYETQNYNKNWINLSKNDLFFRISVFFHISNSQLSADNKYKSSFKKNYRSQIHRNGTNRLTIRTDHPDAPTRFLTLEITFQRIRINNYLPS